MHLLFIVESSLTIPHVAASPGGSLPRRNGLFSCINSASIQCCGAKQQCITQTWEMLCKLYKQVKA